MSNVQIPPDSTGKFLRTTLVGGEHVQHVADEFGGGEALAEQAGAGAVLTFAFSAPVQLAVVESFGSGLVSRADPFGGTPSVAAGVPCRHEAAVFLPVTTSAVRVFAPTGASVNVWGYRR